MANSADHQGKWRHNRSFLASLSDYKYCDWMVTAAFYTAIHAIESLLTKDGASHDGTHRGRNYLLKSRQRYATLYRSFLPLYNLSIVSRYHCHTGPGLGSPDWISASEVQSLVVNRYLHGIEKLIVQLLVLKREEFPPISLSAPSVESSSS